MFSFSFVKKLGQSNSSQVVEVLNYKDMKKYAAKQVIKSKQSEELFSKLLILNHPNITKIYDFEISDKDAFYLMELLHEKSLHNYIFNIKLQLQDLLFYSAQVLLALQYLHENNIVYRSLDAQNLLLQKNGYVKLSRLNHSKILKQGQRTYTILEFSQYTAPEILQGKGHSFSIDYWSFGILLYEFTFGELPFNGNSPFEIQESILKQKLEISTTIDKSLYKLIKQLLTKNPNKRIEKVISFQNLLKNHELFKKIDIELLQQQKLMAPFYP